MAIHPNMMRHQARLMTILAAQVLFSATCVADSFLIGAGASGIRVDMTRHPDSIHCGSAGSDWNLRLNRSSAILQWVVIPFAHQRASELKSDASITATVKSKSGPLGLSPSKAVDQTNLHKRKKTASVTMFAQGAGRATIELQVGIVDPYAAAGEHATNVTLSITAP